MLLKLFLAVIIVSYFRIASCLNVTTNCEERRVYVNAVLDLKGHIYSPGFFENGYPDDLYCAYLMTTSPYYKIKLTFHEFDVEPFGNCAKDAVSIYDGSSGFKPLVGVYCGNELPRPIVSSGHELFVRFTSNFLGNRKGFHLEFEASATLSLCEKGYSECKNRKCYRTGNKCDGKDDCGDGTDEEGCNLPVANFECGINPIEPTLSVDSDRIVGGTEVRPGSWPWQVDLQENYAYPNSHVCGGALINPQWLVTATHCIGGLLKPENWRIHLGNHHKYKTDEGEQVRYVERIIIYPGITGDEIVSYSRAHDMALMKLSSPVTITDYVRPVCLPPAGYELTVGTSCISTGWGETRGSGFAEVLKQTKASVRAGSECPGYYDNKTMVCVKSNKEYEGACHGDSGGPLNCKMGEKWYVMGVTSFGSASNLLSFLCAQPGSGTIYNKVSNKTEWIQEMIERYS